MSNFTLPGTSSTCPQDTSGQFRPPTTFFTIRTFMLGCIFFLSFVWLILLCIAIFVQSVNMNIVERNMISIILLIEFLTIILVPLLLAKDFRLWLDAARSLFIFVSHFGVAVWFACKAPSMKCVAGDEQTICASLILSILIFSWVIPVLVVMYSCALGFLYYRLSKLTGPTPSTATSTMDDAEMHQKRVRHSSFCTSFHVSHASSGSVV